MPWCHYGSYSLYRDYRLLPKRPNQRKVIIPPMNTNPDEIIRNYERWLHKIANGMLEPASPYHDDLVQEGRLAMWHALSSFNREHGALPSWLTRAALYKMRETVRRQRWTGQPARNHGQDKARQSEPVSIDAEIGDGITLADTLAAPDILESAELAYHEGEIFAALTSLTPNQREYVFNRFWRGMSTEELPKGLWQRIRPKLRQELAHLEGAVS